MYRDRYGDFNWTARRRLPFLLLGVVLALLAAAPARAGTLLFPDLKTLAPRDLRFDRADVDPNGGGVMHNVLRFSNTVWDASPGPLELRSQINPTTKTGLANQRVYEDTGGFANYAAGSFYYHPAHQHYHYDNWGRYELWSKAGYEAWLAAGRTQGNPLVGSKTTSCMIDEEFVRGMPNQPYPARYEWEGCFPNSQGMMLQGISAGWGDTYDYFRFEQWIDLGSSGSLADGQYVLRSVVDPANQVYESPSKADPGRESQADNEAITAFAVQNGQLVDSNAPSGSVRINDIDPATSSPDVTVKVLGRDDISGVAQVRLSNDGNTWAAPQPYTGKESTAQPIPWSLTDSRYGGTAFDGTKTVYVEFEDATGKWSSPCESDSIVLDRPGIAAGTQPALAASCLGLPATIAATATPKPAARCLGVRATIVGTAHHDTLVGTRRRDVIAARGGNDKIASLGGKDLVCAGSGNDHGDTGSADDRVAGGAGNDRLLGRGGADLLMGSAGNDVLSGNGGSDRLRGGPGLDACRDASGGDSMAGCER